MDQPPSPLSPEKLKPQLFSFAYNLYHANWNQRISVFEFQRKFVAWNNISDSEDFRIVSHSIAENRDDLESYVDYRIHKWFEL